MRRDGDYIGAEALTSGHSTSDLPDGLVDFLRVIAVRPEWMKDSLCREPEYVDVSFFPERGASTAEAKALCRRCLVAEECRVYADENPASHQHGIWGGTSSRERRQGRGISSRPAA